MLNAEWVIIGSDFYFIANAQLQIFRAMYKEGAYDRAGLADVVVMKTRLNPWYLGRHRPDPDAAAVHPFGVAAAAQEKRELLRAGLEPEHTRARILARNE